MDLQKIKALIDLVSSSRLSELEMDDGDFRLRLSRGDAPSARNVAHLAATAAASTVSAPASRPAPVPKAASKVVPDAAPAGHVVTAAMYGVFYLATAPNDPPFVRVGDVVRKGQKLCMLESMKLFHAMEADRDGRIEAILAESGQEVEIGQPLFRFE